MTQIEKRFFARSFHRAGRERLPDRGQRPTYPDTDKDALLSTLKLLESNNA